MIELSDRIKSMEESATIAMSRKSRELNALGKDVISLSLGEPDFNTPDFIKDAAKEGMDQNYTKYMAVPGYEDLRESISKKFLRDNNLNYSKDQIVVSTGAKQSIANRDQRRDRIGAAQGLPQDKALRAPTPAKAKPTGRHGHQQHAVERPSPPNAQHRGSGR